MGWSHAEKIFDPESGYTLQAGGGHGVEGVGAVYPGVDRRGPSLAAGQYPVWPRVS